MEGVDVKAVGKSATSSSQALPYPSLLLLFLPINLNLNPWGKYSSYSALSTVSLFFLGGCRVPFPGAEHLGREDSVWALLVGDGRWVRPALHPPRTQEGHCRATASQGVENGTRLYPHPPCWAAVDVVSKGGE